MFDFHEKRKIKSWLFSKPMIAVLLIASALFATSVYERYKKERETAEKHAERLIELDRLKAHAAALEADVEYMESNRGIEEEIRDRFDAVKKGEQAVVVMNEAPVTSSTTSAAPVLPEVVSAEGAFSWLFFWR
ncbi:hypothetical protein HY416_03260 [Candidatus Kaiserbacteria bacterium]|nr:hypothetical protein [Candidatus Kaiserbacteria bacterium]